MSVLIHQTVPSIWGKCIINPIPKSPSADARDPLSYRGIALASVMYKMYCNILNNRLSIWAEANDKLADEQNGFRKKRSTMDHVSSITSLIETRKEKQERNFYSFYRFFERHMLLLIEINYGNVYSTLVFVGKCYLLLNHSTHLFLHA